ncbi:four helix bundle protein [Ereboglobus sp. PH5-5]|uniref:four helix bundle protein n=1 Tax=unclassified Ereboglobus TaxID=2626932 RepID=UPI002406ACB5|nr:MULTISPECIES: four helix bundle protein [unclassified Ereboglobus]MDF9827392.1 four helix bundle protein [Ereboglobus sp. PH5-10]MDF9833956.1 four helix bundle protein [Ereboglobus sp. PH5-5]
MKPPPENLEARTAEFAANIRSFARKLPRTISNMEDVKQLVRASGSVAANCIEANESLGEKDKLLHFQISRKEAKECGLWLRLVHIGEAAALDKQRNILAQESHELRFILSAIIKKLE